MKKHRRPLLAFLSVAAITLVVTGLVWHWLQGTPFAQTPDITVLDDVGPGDLLAPGAAEISGGEEELPVPASAIPVVKRTTPPLRHTQNILLVGIDRRPGANRGGRSDTLLVAILDRGSEHVGVVSVPRDLYVNYPDHGPARINAAFGIARKNGGNGMELLSRVVSDTLAMPIHHNVAVDLNIFESAVDAVGGVTVDAPCPIQDNFIDPRTPNGRRWLDVKTGPQLMDGPTAAMYVRSRHGRSDWDRARRQQLILLAMKNRVLSGGGLGRLPALLEEFGSAVATDMTRLQLLDLSRRALATSPSHLHGLVLGHKQTDHFTTEEGRWVLIPDFPEIDRALKGLFSELSPGTRPASAVCPPADIALQKSARQRAKRHRMRSKDGGVAQPSLDREPAASKLPQSSSGASSSSP